MDMTKKIDIPIILLYGMPRSGTTWIGKIFDSDRNTFYRHEPDTWKKLTKLPMLESANSFNEYCAYLHDYIDEFVTSNRIEVNGKLPIFPKAYSLKIRQLAYAMSIYFSSAIAKVNNNIRLPVIRLINPSSGNNYVVVWKSIQLLGRVGVITRCLSNYRGIHILRNPCGYISSILEGERMGKFSSETPASEDYPLYEALINTDQARRYNLTIEGFKGMHPEERLAWRWVLFNEKAYDDTKDDANTKILKYEDMCNDPVETARSFFDFCDLSMTRQSERFLSHSVDKDSSSYYSVYKNPKLSVDKWKNKLTKEQICRIEEIANVSRIGRYYTNDFGR